MQKPGTGSARLLHLLSSLPFIALLFGSTAFGATYEVGPGRALTSIGQVPWATLQPGDTVLIHYRATPYREKWVICRQGTATAPITVRGVADPATGALPIIDGSGAVTAPGLNYWSEDRGVLKIGGASRPADTTPRYIVIENLDLRGARSSYQFTDDGGLTQSYSDNASPIYLEKGEDITIRNCTLHDGGNGFFVASSGSTLSRNILVEGSYIYDNGNVGSIYEHNSYTEALGITFQYNRFGPLRAGAPGNNLKDRSAGLVVRYNWLEGGNRQLDLVNSQGNTLIRNDPSYRATHVYGNILVENAGDGNRQIVHYGGDTGDPASYRKGILYFFNNTLISRRTDRTTVFRLTTNEERCDARNNIFYAAAAAGNTVSLLDASGVLDVSHNWMKPGWVRTFGTLLGTVNDDGTMLESSSPGFVNEAAGDYRLAGTSICVDIALGINPAVVPTHNLTQQYVRHRSSEPRPSHPPLDLGAYEY
jgi:parallel beta-helix repeat protein